MKVFYDGLNLEKYSKLLSISGFTTNCTFFSQNDIRNYNEFYEKNKQFIGDKSISFQIWENGNFGIKQIDEIHSINRNFFVKIPIIYANNTYNNDLITYALNKNISVNITAVYTINQLDVIYELIKNSNNNIIVSIFGGPISDTGIDPSPIILYSKKLFKDMNNVEILWAGCRELYTITRAKLLGCDIITIPGDIIDKMNLKDYDLSLLSLERVNKFKNDAINGNISIL
jgi:transaldolase